VTLTAAKLRGRLRQAFLGLLVFILGTAALSFAVDFAFFRLRVASHRSPYGSVVVTHYYAVPQKSGKTQFIFDPPLPETCVNALYPHAGMQPCWYLRGHREQHTNM